MSPEGDHPPVGERGLLSHYIHVILVFSGSRKKFQFGPFVLWSEHLSWKSWADTTGKATDTGLEWVPEWLKATLYIWFLTEAGWAPTFPTSHLCLSGWGLDIEWTRCAILRGLGMWQGWGPAHKMCAFCFAYFCSGVLCLILLISQTLRLGHVTCCVTCRERQLVIHLLRIPNQQMGESWRSVSR